MPSLINNLTYFCMFQIAIPVISVSEIKKTKTAILVPNALIIATAQERVRLIDIFIISINIR